jgi:hypothetical protein
MDHKILRRWAALGNEILKSQTISWKPVEQIINEAKPLQEYARKEFKRLLDESNEQLDPLKDSFKIDYGVHRWLKSKREEVYSDWLAWILEQIKNEPKEILKLLNCDQNTQFNGVVEIKREKSFAATDGDDGRLDIEVCSGTAVHLIIEVKTHEPNQVELKKQLQKQKRSCKANQYIILAPSIEYDDIQGWTPITWKTLCIALRNMAVEMVQEKRISEAAMVLSFVGAVEQNILGFPSDSDHVPRTSAEVDYLQETLKGGSHND